MKDKFFLARSEGENIIHIRELSLIEIELYDAQKSIITDFNRHFKLIEYVYSNFNEFKTFIENTLKDAAEANLSLSGFNYDLFISKLNSTLLNLMMSVRTFLDHMETHIKRTKGEDSTEFKLFDNLTSSEFDGHFSYAFMYKLRNFVQHCGMPPIKFSVGQDYNESPPIVELTLKFEKNVLLSEFKKWGLVKQPLMEQEELFDVLPIVEGLMSSLLRIYINYSVETSYDLVLDAKSKMLKFIQEPDSYRSDDYCIAKTVESESNKVNFQLRWIPTSLLGKVDEFENIKSQI